MIIPVWLLFSILTVHQIFTAATFPVAKIGLAQFDPLVYAFYRFLFCSLAFIPILIRQNVKSKISGPDKWKLFWIGMLLIPFNQVLYLIGQKMTSAGHASLMFATVPVFVYILAIKYLNEKMSVLRSLGIIVALVGVMIVLFSGKLKFGQEYLTGDLLILVAVIAWAIATVVGKPLATKYGAFRTTGTALVFGSLVYLPFGAIWAIRFDYSSVNYIGWLSVLYMAIVVSVIIYVAWYWILKYLAASRVAVLQNVQPIIATALAAIMIGETVTASFIIGGIIVIFGVVLSQIR